MTGPGSGGRRERSKQEKHDRIFAAASALFEERGFDGVTTQEISERADVAAGTLFRYAASKGDLFLMVYNDQLRRAVAAGAAKAAAEPDLAEAVFALVEPILSRAQHSPTSAMYQRELLFGSPGQEFRAEGLALVSDLEQLIADRLHAAAPAQVPRARAREAASRAARTVFAILNLLLVEPLTGLHSKAGPSEEMRQQVTQVVRGYLACLNHENTTCTPVPAPQPAHTI